MCPLFHQCSPFSCFYCLLCQLNPKHNMVNEWPPRKTFSLELCLCTLKITIVSDLKTALHMYNASIQIVYPHSIWSRFFTVAHSNVQLTDQTPCKLRKTNGVPYSIKINCKWKRQLYCNNVIYSPSQIQQKQFELNGGSPPTILILLPENTYTNL